MILVNKRIFQKTDDTCHNVTHSKSFVVVPETLNWQPCPFPQKHSSSTSYPLSPSQFSPLFTSPKQPTTTKNHLYLFPTIPFNSTPLTDPKPLKLGPYVKPSQVVIFSNKSLVPLKTLTLCFFSSVFVFQELKASWRLALATVIGFLGSAFGTVGGVGGGGIFVPMLTLIIGFDTKSAAALSKCNNTNHIVFRFQWFDFGSWWSCLCNWVFVVFKVW